MKFIVTFCLATICLTAPAMDRLAALSEIESGNNDLAVGIAHEVSRYQITPKNWKNYSLSGEEPANERDARAVLARILQPRCKAFESKNGRSCNDFEFYLLWHCPAHVNHPNAAESDLARRFANLCAASPTFAPLRQPLRHQT